MPCQCDVPEPTERNREVTRVRALLSELATGLAPNPATYGRGTDGGYPADTRDLDQLTHQLCEQLQALGPTVSYRSLEMQIWWRDHKAADKARIEASIQATTDTAARLAALSKLTDYERRLLGIK
jgi:hypothetical protein